MNCDIEQKLISTTECFDFLLKQVKVSDIYEEVLLKEAFTRVLFDDVLTQINVPNFDNSAMDGYAINFDNTDKPPYSFKLMGRIAAGEVGEKLEKNCAMRIFTGAKIPKNTNTVAIQERCEELNGNVEVFGFLVKDENIRKKGEDIKAGDIILKQGTKLDAVSIGLLASIGVSKIKVFKKLKVGVFFSGDELVEPEKQLQDGQIYNSNRYSINALLTGLGFEIIDLGNVKDDFKQTCQVLIDLSKKCDVIITTGGVSVGEEDHIRPALEKVGEVKLHNIKMKPGKPLAYGRINKTHFVGLPGNPVSAMVTFELFIKPFLLKLSGNNNYQHQIQKVQIPTDIGSRSRREFLRVRLDKSSIPPMAIIYKNQGSGVLSSISWADGLLEIPDEKSFKKGEILNFYPL